MNILGIGTDIIECLRIAQMIERHGELFIRRVYTEHEIGYCSTKKSFDPALRRPLGSQRSGPQSPRHRLEKGHQLARH